MTMLQGLITAEREYQRNRIRKCGREKENSVCNGSEYYMEKCKRNSGTWKMENRKRRVQYTEKTGILSGTPFQSRLLEDEEPLLSNTDRTLDRTDYRSKGVVVEESKTE